LHFLLGERVEKIHKINPMSLSKFSILLLSLLLLCLGVSCDDDTGSSGNACGSNFDQTAMLESYTGTLILGRYLSVVNISNNLIDDANDFLDDPTASTLDEVQNKFLIVYNLWMEAEPFNFGPAADLELRTKLNSFPVNEELVDELVTNGTPVNYAYTFDQGFPALDYLLFNGTQEEVAGRFTDLPENANRRAYLNDQVSQINQLTNEVLELWGNGYRATFEANSGTAAGTSVSLLINALNEHWENTKRDRLGIPAGVATLGFTNPESVEAPYSGASLELLINAVKANRNFFTNSNSVGLDDYLNNIDAQKEGTLLTTLIANQYQVGLDELDRIEGTLKVAVDEDYPDVIAAYGSLVRNIVLLKTDMASMLCVAITYVDNPSDSD
jgi:predicted lipoprotein